MLIESTLVRRLAIVVALVALACMTAACIFDEGGDYNGGGRRDTGAKLNQGDEPQTDDDGGTGDEDSGGGPFPGDSGSGG